MRNRVKAEVGVSVNIRLKNLSEVTEIGLRRIANQLSSLCRSSRMGRLLGQRRTRVDLCTPVYSRSLST